MKGCLKRDVYHLALSAKFYLVLLVILLVMGMVSDFNNEFFYLYVMVFGASLLLGLFSYDEMSGWQAYAAAMPDGRRAQVNARYATTMLLMSGTACILLLNSALSRSGGGWSFVLLYLGIFLSYMAITLPLSYRFGARSRLILILLIAIGGGAMGAAAIAMPDIHGVGRDHSALAPAGVPLFLLGGMGMILSRRISLAIMAKKEF